MKSKLTKKCICLIVCMAMLACSGCGKAPAGAPGGDAGQESSAGQSSASAAPQEGGSEQSSAGDVAQESSAGQSSASAAPQEGRVPQDPVDSAAAVADFGVRLLRQGIGAEGSDGGNQLYSPLSVLLALAMAANGAAGETLSQMEEAFGVSVPELSAYLSAYEKALPAGEDYKLSMANGIWFTQDPRFAVNEDFLKANEGLFGASVRRVPFDNSALQEINGWVKDNTDGMIEKILNEIPADAVMYLVNAIAFDAKWQEVYRSYQVQEGDFTRADGTVQKAQMMYSEEGSYLEGAHETGFLKYYRGGKYAFAALLPEEGMEMAEYADSLTGERLRELLSGSQQTAVDACIPKFKNEYGIELGEILRQMGMKDAFDSGLADFSGIGSSASGNIYISRVQHKTFIEVDEAGTKAAAVTSIEMEALGAVLPTERKTVHLDRPFLYLIIDCEELLPVFIGTVADVEKSGQ